jgi:hypothetical protein
VTAADVWFAQVRRRVNLDRTCCGCERLEVECDGLRAQLAAAEKLIQELRPSLWEKEPA